MPTGVYIRTIEHRLNQSLANKGQPNKGSFQKGRAPWNKGKTGIYSPEHLQKMSDSQKGKLKLDFVAREEMINAYEAENLTMEQIGQRYGASGHAVKNRMKQLGISIRSTRESRRRTKPFFHLSKGELGTLYLTQNLTSSQIAQRYNIGRTSVLRRLEELNIPRRQQDVHGWSWKGKKSSHGYTLILLDKDDPMRVMANNRGYVLEHRLVMARHLGRPLLTTEVVHHRPDVARDDNRIEVLYLMPNPSEHGKLIPCSNCELKKEIRLLRWQIKEQGEQIRNLTRALSGLDG